MAKKINLQLEDDVVMIAMTIITDDGENKGTYSVEQRLYTTEDFESEDETWYSRTWWSVKYKKRRKAVLFVVFLIGVFIAAFIGLLLIYIGNRVFNKMKMDDMNSEMEMKIKKEVTNFKEKSEWKRLLHLF